MAQTDKNFAAEDLVFDKFQGKLVTFLTAGKTTKFTLTPAEITKIKDLSTAWTTKFGLYSDKSTKTPVITLEKNEARKALTEYLRFLVGKYITGNDLVTDGDREHLGLTVKDMEPTPVHIPDWQPKLIAKSNEGGEIVLRLVYPEDEKKRAIPDGADGFEVFQLMGKESANEKDYTFAGIASKNPYKILFRERVLVGTKVSFVIRLYNKKGETGRWSNFVTTVII